MTDNVRLIDTHCHIHDPEFAHSDYTPDQVIERAVEQGVESLICVGTDVDSSTAAVTFSTARDRCYAAVAVHPHEAAEMTEQQMQEAANVLEQLIVDDAAAEARTIVAIGECGFDYFYHDDPNTHKKQEMLLRLHLDLAVKHNMPLIFHVRDQKNAPADELGHGFAHFFDVIKDYDGLTGVMHSFSAGLEEMQGAIERGFHIGLNGIMTFTKDENQLAAARGVPLEKLVLETDAPFLTPKPFRGTMCEPKHVRVTAEFLSELRGESLQTLSRSTTANAQRLFGIQ